MSRLSATTAFAPPGPRSLAIVVSRWRRSSGRSFMAVQGRGRCNQGQDYPNHRLRGENYEFAMGALGDGRPVGATGPCNVVELPAVHGLHQIYLPKAA
jgi:hypothetical protein